MLYAKHLTNLKCIAAVRKNGIVLIIRLIKIFVTVSFFLLWGTVQSNAFQSRLNKNQLSQKETSALLRDIQKNKKNLDAHFNLGKHYNQTHEWQLAKKHLLKSYALTLTKKNFKKKAGILYELAQTYRAVGEIRACEDALKGVKNLVTPQAKIWDSVILQLAEVLYLQNRFNEAMAQLAAYDYKKKPAQYEQLSGAIIKAVEIDKIYLKAVEAQSEGRSTKARSLYHEIDNKFPGFRDVQERLNKIHKELLFNETATGAAAENTNEDLGANRSIPVEHKEEPSKRKISPRNKVSAPKQTKQVSKSNTVSISKDNFTRKPIESPKDKKRIEKITRQQYVTLNTELLSSKTLIRTDINRPSVKISIPKNKIENSNKPSEQKKPVWAATFFVAFILTGTGLTIYLNPSFRARTLTLLGRKEDALQLYENLIAEKPQMLWLYPYLAKLYDHFNRQDLKAIRVYKIMQHLRLRSNADDSFVANISNKYLSHETTNVKIEILKNNNS